jgi:superfamily II DNA or RNA helicase
MNEVIKLEYLNEVHGILRADVGTMTELTEYFSFRPEGYRFTPSYKNKMWDGFIRLTSPRKPTLYVGLIDYVAKFCADRGYDLTIAPEYGELENCDDDYGYQLAKEVGATLEPYDYQNEYVVNAIRKRRSLNLSPTSSGKSFIQYLIMSHYRLNLGLRTLIIVPTTGLVQQMANDFIDYGCDPRLIYQIQGGVDKKTKHPIVVSTWQSLTKLPKEWFDQFGVVFGDEAHLFTAKSLQGIMEKMPDTRYRHGFTGTISKESKTHRLVLQGLFGSVKEVVRTKDLIEKGAVATFNVKALVLNHTNEAKSELRKKQRGTEKARKYALEKDFLVNFEKRNLFIRNLVWSLEGQNNLILFDLVEKHGKVLEPLLRREDRVLHFIHGGTNATQREHIRHLIENDPLKRHDILASYGVFSTGVSIKRLDNAIFASAYKSEIKVLQSIGRTLRKGNGSDNATLYDIADDLSVNDVDNYSLTHFKKRVEIYSEQHFPLKIFNINI